MSLEQAGLSGGMKRPPSGSTYLERARLVRVRVRVRVRVSVWISVDQCKRLDNDQLVIQVIAFS